MMLRPAILLALILTLPGCGSAAILASGDARLEVTRNFGEIPVVGAQAASPADGETVLDLLERNGKVQREDDNKQVMSIDGVGGAGQTNTGSWNLYLNGVLAEEDAATSAVKRGTRIWWDFHRQLSALDSPAVVGSFPEPFLSGIGDGRRHPLRLECAASKQLCSEVQSRFGELGIPASIGEVSGSFTKKTLRMLIGPWQKIGGDVDVEAIARGPRVSGVFAVPSADGATIRTLDRDGRTVRKLGPATGLIAAIRRPVEKDEERRDPAWVLTGTDEAGVRAAVEALDEGALAGRFAVVVSDGRPSAVPVRR